MAQLVGKRFDNPDEVREFTEGKGRVELVDLNGHSVGRGTFEPGWRWSQNVKPLAGTDSCQVEHIGYVLEGRMALKMDDGTEREFGPGDAFHMPPGHDAWIVGDQLPSHATGKGGAGCSLPQTPRASSAGLRVPPQSPEVQ